MRSLSPAMRSACFFYGIFSILLIACTVFANTRIETALVEPPLDDTEQLMTLSDQLQKRWDAVLDQAGLDDAMVNRTETVRLQECLVASQKITWVTSSSVVTLPESNNENTLVSLGGDWKRAAQEYGLDVQDLKWNYRNNRLRLHLPAKRRLNLKGGYRTFLIGELIIVQPFSKPVSEKFNWRGMIPEHPPVLAETSPKVEEVTSAQIEQPKNEPKLSIEPSRPPLPKIEPPKIPDGEIPSVKRRARVSIIIDDVGFVRGPADKMLEVPARLTWAILPLSPYGSIYEDKARQKGFEIMLHLPLEPFSNTENPGPGLIRREWSEAEIMRQLEVDLNNVSKARGVNNHMGSAGTGDQRLMDILMREFKRRNLYFIDSYTSNRSVGQQFARKHQVPFARRQIFIDHYDSYEAKRKALQDLIRIALRDGEAIGIGHVRDGTAEAIMEMLPEFAKAGIEIVPVSELVR